MWKKGITAFFALFFTFFSQSPAYSNHLSACQLPSLNKSYHQDVGWPRDSDSMPSIGEQKILILLVDFPDSRSNLEKLRSLPKAMDLNTVRAFYQSVSNNIFNPKFEIYPEILTLDKMSDSYGGNKNEDSIFNGEFQSHILVRDALDKISSVVNIKNYASAIIVVSSGKSLSGEIASATSTDTDIEHLSGLIHNYVLVGYGKLQNESIKIWRVLVHELNHLLGITDLYLYSKDGWWQGKTPGPFGQQGFLQGDSKSDSLAYNRWLRGWIDDSKIKCIPQIENSMNLQLHAQASKDLGYEMILIRISDNKLLVFESPKERGFSSKTHARSLLIYTVDNSIKIGDGPVRLVPKRTSVTSSRLTPSLPDWERFQDAALLAGESVRFENFVIINRTTAKTGSLVKFQILVGSDAFKSSISCTKQKQVINVSGYQPKCPSGFRQQ